MDEDEYVTPIEQDDIQKEKVQQFIQMKESS